MLHHIAARLAALRATDSEQIALQTTGNAVRLFPRLSPEGVR
jgi:Tat protein secretion system quality control protein TatD with DNase activity